MDPDRGLYDEAFFDSLARADESARRVLGHVLAIVQPTSVVDIGCGPGVWLRTLNDLHPCDIIGVDGDHVPAGHRVIPPSSFVEHDLSTPLSLDRTFDLALSLEVAEHLPPSRAAGFVGDIAALAPVVVFSAAVPEQGGVNHVNEQWPSYWVDLFRNVGFTFHDVIRPTIWADEEIAFCYRQNLLLFTAESHAHLVTRTRPPVVDIAHPELVRQLASDSSQTPALRKVLRSLPGAASVTLRSLAARRRHR